MNCPGILCFCRKLFREVSPNRPLPKKLNTAFFVGILVFGRFFVYNRYDILSLLIRVIDFLPKYMRYPMKTYDIAIIGGGPAGYTAALYSGRAGYSAVVIEKMAPGGQMAITSNVENYPGFGPVSGFELAEKMMEGAERFGAESMFGEVTSVRLAGETKYIAVDGADIDSGDDNVVAARAVVLATGASPRKLGIPGELQYEGRGVSYCATCDGMFFKGKTVVVAGGGDTAFEDALYLSNICEKVYLVHRRDAFRAAASSVKRAEAKENIEFVKNALVSEIKGENGKVSALVYTDKDSGETRELPCSAVFAAFGRTPDTALFDGQIALDPSGYIIADETCRTSVDGVFAAGDVRTKHLRQIVTACADGATAISFAEEWLNK